MQFHLPENLKEALIPYDATLKKLQPKKTSISTRSKPKFPLGMPTWLVPQDIYDPKQVETYLQRINETSVESRFVYLKDEPTFSSLLIYHFESVWVACWAPAEQDKDKYVYGISFAFKDTEANRKKVERSYLMIMEKDPGNVTYSKVGRTEWASYTITVTKEVIEAKGKTALRGLIYWKHPNIRSYAPKSQDLSTAVTKFEESVLKNVPYWKDNHKLYGHSMFARLFMKHPLEVAVFRDEYLCKRLVEYFSDKELNATNYIQLMRSSINNAMHNDFEQLRHSLVTTLTTAPCNLHSDCTHIIDTPFFKTHINKVLNECKVMFEDPSNEYLTNVSTPWYQLSNLIRNISFLNLIYPDVPIDFYRTYVDMLEVYNFRYNINSSTREWIKTHIPFESFINMMHKEYMNAISTGQRLREDYSEGHKLYSSHYLNDTINLLGQVISYQQEHPEYDFNRPKRWRLVEFHDYLVAETWKFNNKNENLPQGLFPEPIKVERNATKWTLFQPADVHQLAQWGRAVRNCVGGASSYREGIKKKEHFIVLCMVDNAPRFTIQLKLSNGVMDVVQIADVANQRLDQQLQYEYQQVFQEALKIQAAKLSS